MNKVVLIGRLTADPMLKYLPGNGTAATNVTLAVDKYNPSTGQREADFIPITIWGKQAESTCTYMLKGSMMAIAGRVQVRSFDDKEGNKKWVTEIVANETTFLGKSNNQQNNNIGDTSDPQYAGPSNSKVDDMTPVDDDGDIPF